MSAMKEVSEQIRKALDDLPVHSQQLFHMFRKHRVKTGDTRMQVEATDTEALKHAKDVVWKKDSWHTPERIIGTGKGHRPYPGGYLDADYIRDHLELFKDGATRFYRTEDLDEYGPGNKGTTFVIPTHELEAIKQQAKGDPKELGRLLGLGENFFVDAAGNPVAVTKADFSPEDVANLNLRMADGNEGFGNGGANSEWIPGGLLPDGNHEAVVSIDSESQGGTFDRNFDFSKWK
jgi:hypothetical protein